MDIKDILDSDFKGNIYIVKDGEVICESVTGFADLANEIPNTIETKFASASAGKVFVAVAILPSTVLLLFTIIYIFSCIFMTNYV